MHVVVVALVACMVMGMGGTVVVGVLGGRGMRMRMRGVQAIGMRMGGLARQQPRPQLGTPLPDVPEHGVGPIQPSCGEC